VGERAEATTVTALVERVTRFLTPFSLEVENGLTVAATETLSVAAFGRNLNRMIAGANPVHPRRRRPL